MPKTKYAEINDVIEEVRKKSEQDYERVREALDRGVPFYAVAGLHWRGLCPNTRKRFKSTPHYGVPKVVDPHIHIDFIESITHYTCSQCGKRL